jgi:hypothetical protein
MSVFLVGSSADAFVPSFCAAAGASSASHSSYSPQKIPNKIQIHRISKSNDIYGIYMPYPTTPFQSMLTAHRAHDADVSPGDLSRREAVDIALGALTGWILGPRVSLAAAPDTMTEYAEPLVSDRWEEHFEILLESQHKFGSALVPEKHREAGEALAEWVARQNKSPRY